MDEVGKGGRFGRLDWTSHLFEMKFHRVNFLVGNCGCKVNSRSLKCSSRRRCGFSQIGRRSWLFDVEGEEVV